MKLTESQKHYIQAVFELFVVNSEPVRVSDIAVKIGVAKSSVSIAMRILEKKGLVLRSESGRVSLTPDGERNAIMIMGKFNIIKNFLMTVLSVDEATADEDAAAIEHVISGQALCSFCRYIKRPENLCPYIKEKNTLLTN